MWACAYNLCGTLGVFCAAREQLCAGMRKMQILGDDGQEKMSLADRWIFLAFRHSCFVPCSCLPVAAANVTIPSLNLSPDFRVPT